MNNSDSPAHPKPNGVNFETATVNGWSGLTKREMMAMHIMANICYNTTDRNQPQHYEYAAESAVNLADALLKELEK